MLSSQIERLNQDLEKINLYIEELRFRGDKNREKRMVLKQQVLDSKIREACQT